MTTKADKIKKKLGKIFSPESIQEVDVVQEKGFRIISPTAFYRPQLKQLIQYRDRTKSFKFWIGGIAIGNGEIGVEITIYGFEDGK